MTLTPEQRRRAVDVMAIGLQEKIFGKSASRAWDNCTHAEKFLRRGDAEAALTALLAVADVTWKDDGDG